MGLVAAKTRMMMGQRYRKGDPVDTSGWPSGVAERLQTLGRLVWEGDGTEQERKREATAKPAAPQESEPPAPPQGAEAGAGTNQDGAEAGAGDVKGSEPAEKQKPVAVNLGRGWYQLPDGSKMQGRAAVEEAGYEVKESA